MDWNSNDLARFVAVPFERVPAEIAAKPGRTNRGDVPLPAPRKLLRQTPIQRHTIRVPNRQQPPPGAAGAGQGGPGAGTAGKKEEEVIVQAGTTVVTPPSDFGTAILAYNLDDERLLGYVDDRQRVQPREETGRVRVYTIFAGELRFYPAPNSDTEILLRYYAVWPELEDDGDEPVFPELVARHACLPSLIIRVTSATAKRSLNDPVGLFDSSLK